MQQAGHVVIFYYRGRYTQTLSSVFPPRRLNVKVVTKNVQNNLSKNEVNLPNHVHLMWQVDYTFLGGILTQAVFGVVHQPRRQNHENLLVTIPQSSTEEFNGQHCCSQSAVEDRKLLRNTTEITEFNPITSSLQRFPRRVSAQVK